MANNYQYALITGGTSGIGYEIARQFAKHGYNLVIVARKEERLADVQMEFSDQFGIDVITIEKNLFEPNAAKEIYEEIKNKQLDIYALVNNAGQGQWGKFIETDLQRNLDLIHLDIVTPVALTWYFLKDMVRRNEGKILQVGSEVSKAPSPLLSVYGASKAFLLSFTEALINEVKDTNVTLTLLMPGATDTDFFRKADAEHTVNYREKELGSPEEVAEDAFEALMDGNRRIVSGAKSHVAMSAMLPDNLVAENTRKTLEPSDKSEGREMSDHEPSQRERKVHENEPQEVKNKRP